MIKKGNVATVTVILTKWNEILSQVYPDYAASGDGNIFGAAVAIDQAFIFQNLLPAFEARGWTYDPATGLGNLAITVTVATFPF